MTTDDEQRVWVRLVPLNTAAAVWIDGVGPIRGEIVDESTGGAGVALEPGVADLEPGRALTLELDGRRFEATVVTFVRNPDDGGARLGCLWKEPGPFKAGNAWVVGDLS
ncbi:MAG: hypothetical protein ACRC1K_01340 [Planctomycetia bacterium]